MQNKDYITSELFYVILHIPTEFIVFEPTIVDEISI